MTQHQLDAMITKAKSIRPELSSRIDGGRKLLERHFQAGPRAGLITAKVGSNSQVWTWTVKSASSGTAYQVIQWADKTTSCNCPDSQSRGVVCKHGWAVRMLRRMM
jgi:hypothetical protein